MGDNRIGYVIYILDSENIAKSNFPSFPFWPVTADRGRLPPPWIPHPAGLAEVPCHVPDGHYPPTILTTNPHTHTPTEIHSQPYNAVCTPASPKSPTPSLHSRNPATTIRPPPPDTPLSSVTYLGCSHSPRPARPHVIGEVPVRYTSPAPPHTPSASPPTSPPPRTSHDDRRESPSSPPPGHSPRTQTSLFLPLSDALYLHASPNQLSTCTTSRTSHTYISNPHSLSSRSSQASPHRLPTRTHAQTVFHAHPDDPFSLSPTSSIRSCHSLTFQHFVQSIPASLKILFQNNTVYLFFPDALLSSSNFLYHPSTATFVRLSFFIRTTRTNLSSTLFSIFHCTLFTPQPRFHIIHVLTTHLHLSQRFPFLLLHTYRQLLSTHFCNLITSFFHHSRLTIKQ